jgi:hypothetical protein
MDRSPALPTSFVVASALGSTAFVNASRETWFGKSGSSVLSAYKRELVLVRPRQRKRPGTGLQFARSGRHRGTRGSFRQRSEPSPDVSDQQMHVVPPTGWLSTSESANNLVSSGAFRTTVEERRSQSSPVPWGISSASFVPHGYRRRAHPVPRPRRGRLLNGGTTIPGGDSATDGRRRGPTGQALNRFARRLRRATGVCQLLDTGIVDDVTR